MFLVEEKTVTQTVTAYIYGYPTEFFTPTRPTPTRPTPTEPTSPEPTPTRISHPTIDDWKQQMLYKLNEIRAQVGKPALSLDNRMNSLAEAHSKYQNSISKMTHSDPSGTLGQRSTRLGIKWSRVAENVAMGYTSVSDVMDGWEKSPGHYKNMIGDYHIVGFGRSGNYWTQAFAKEQ
ncbi:CAP domain-containing protein [Coemansia mojavensis]|nr:CAP domain-containing protein [Coemansia mojavensis]